METTLALAAPTAQLGVDEARDVAAHLQRTLRYPRYRRAAGGVDEPRGITDDEHLGMARQRAVGLDLHAPGRTERHAECRRERGRAHAGRPDDVVTAQTLTAHLDAVGKHSHHRSTEAHLDVERAQLREGARR